MIDSKIDYIDFDELSEDIEETGEYIKADDYDAAEEILNELLLKTDGVYKEDDKERYFCFDSPIQFYLYDMKFSPDKMIKRSEIDYRTFYLSKAHISIAYEKYEEAEEFLKKALYWNPLDTNIFFELARIFVKTNELKKLNIVLKAVRSYILDKVSHAKYFAYMGEYYRLKGDLKTALSLCYISQSVCETSISEKVIHEINEKEEILNPPTIEEIIETLKKDELIPSLDGDVLGMIYDLSYEMQKKLNMKSAMYCLDILYELTGDEKYIREKEYLE